MIRNCLSEAIGTFALVFAGTGAIVINDVAGGSVTHVGVALTLPSWRSLARSMISDNRPSFAQILGLLIALLLLMALLFCLGVLPVEME